MANKVPINDIVAAYRKIRDSIAEAEEAHKQVMAGLEEQLALLGTELLNFCNEQNLDSIRTDAGTVSRRVQTRYWTTDWEAMHKFVVDHEAPFILEKRIHNANLKQFLEDNPDVLPVGLQVDNKYVIHVRKPNAK